MKTLYLMRHAKSSWDFPQLNDHDRPLNERGRDDAPLMGEQLASRDINPELILCSTAVRALSTATLVAHKLGYNLEKIQTDEEIYKADRRQLLSIIQQIPDDIESAMLVAHNFTISELANKLSPEPIADMPTAAVVALQFNCNTWLEISKENGDLLFYDFPKNYRQEKDKDKKKNKDKKKDDDE